MHASSVAKLLDLIVGNVNDKGLLSTLPVIDILIQVILILNLMSGFLDIRLLEVHTPFMEISPLVLPTLSLDLSFPHWYFQFSDIFFQLPV